MLSPTFKTAWRLLVAVGVLLILNHWFGQEIIEALMPWLRWELHRLDDNYRILQLGLATQGGDSVIRLEVTLDRFIVVGKHVVAPDLRGRAVVSTLSLSVLRPMLIGLALLLAWPVQRSAQYLWRLLFGVLLLLLLLPLDVPFVLLGEVWELMIAAGDPGSFSVLIIWKDFLQGGGRLALAICAALAAIALAHQCSPSNALKRLSE